MEATGPDGELSALPRRATTVAAGENIHKYGTSVTHGVHFIIPVAMLYTPPLQAMVNHSEVQKSHNALLSLNPDIACFALGVVGDHRAPVSLIRK